ncbi:MAG: YifB family Mg chelatase-like AAA ATPase [Chloroflexi bacterium]|nr:YifB family Mg chelatase-like AAA ATPase [Chloroflexota bacterium]
MLARVWSCALAGLEGEIVQVEVDVHHGLPHTTIVGLPGAAVRESKDRLYAALRNAGFSYPLARITVNLAPADVRKAGPAYDLPIALGILAASDQLDVDLDDALVIGEMALDGRLRPTQGVLPIAQAARARGFGRLVVPAANAAEASLVEGPELLAAEDVGQLVRHLTGQAPLPAVPPPIRSAEAPDYAVDLAHVRGQAHARRALEIAAAGGHNLLLSGPPGSGKTLLARCIPSILPPLSLDEALEVTAVYSVSGLLPPDMPLLRARPFRSPHHSISAAGLIGGGSWPRPGEVSKAHHGVLFLDELPEFVPAVLEALRQPLEDRRVTIARAAGAATYPASFTLVAARNPCPCGHWGDLQRDCTCSPGAVLRYQQRISGPLLDRIDMHVEVPRVETAQLLSDARAEPSSAVRARVSAVRQRQRERLQPASGVRARVADASAGRQLPASANGEMSTEQIRAHCRLSEAGRRLMQTGLRQLGLSARAYHRVLKLARTIADMEQAADIAPEHLAEALQYRPREAG